MTKIHYKLLKIPIKELKFKWYNRNGKETNYPPETPWLFQVYGKGFDHEKVVKVILPTLDYTNNDNNPIVKIYIQDIYNDAEGEWVYENEWEN